MNYNLLSYAIYLPIIGIIMVKVGWMFYKHGEIYLMFLFKHNQALVASVNKLLLAGYYLLNLGYAVISLAYWEQIHSIVDMLHRLSEHLGIIIIAIAVLHYNNVLLCNYLIKSKTIKQ
ncbi:MAG: hypothetical protein GYB32_04740 [Algicola sp.]|nr:hypothetical protein [Algicola sp.]